MYEIIGLVGGLILGVIALTVYVLTIALRDTVRRLGDMNERLMVLLSASGGNEAAARALIASSRGALPVREPEKKNEPPQGKQPGNGVKITLGGV